MFRNFKIYGANSSGVNQVSELTMAVMDKAIISIHRYFEMCKVIQLHCWSVIVLHQLRCGPWNSQEMAMSANYQSYYVFQPVLTVFISLGNYRSARYRK